MSTATRTRALASITTAAERYDVSAKTIRRRIADGTITGYRVGRLVKVDLTEADERIARPIPAAGGGRVAA